MHDQRPPLEHNAEVAARRQVVLVPKLSDALPALVLAPTCLAINGALPKIPSPPQTQILHTDIRPAVTLPEGLLITRTTLHADMEQSRSRRSGIGSEGENLKGIEEDGFLSGGSSLGDAVFTITNDVHERAEKSHDPRPQLWNSVR